MTDIALPPPELAPPRPPAWARPPREADPLGAALTGLTTALELAAVELRLTTVGVSRVADPQRLREMAAVLEGIGTHIGLAAHGTEQLLGLLSPGTEDEKGGT